MWQKIKDGFRSFMMGRHGGDQLSLTLLIGGIVLSLLSSITRIMIFYYLGLAAYIWAIFRMFSRNNAKRTAENAKYLDFTRNFKTNASQFFVRLNLCIHDGSQPDSALPVQNNRHFFHVRSPCFCRPFGRG